VSATEAPAPAAGNEPRADPTASPRRRLIAERWTLLAGLIPVALMIIWASHNGGYDADTWYWGALVMLAVLTAVLVLQPRSRARLSRAASIALVALAAYLAWSYLSMTWAQVPGWALAGSNRTLLYVLVFALFLVLPWTAETALAALVVYAVGIGAIAFVTMLHLASTRHLGGLVIDGRLAGTTGYFNSTSALFMSETLLGTFLASRRELPGLLRGLLLAFAALSLQLCVMGQSRGWLFTLPAVLILYAVVVRDRLRVVLAAVLPVLAALLPVHKLLHVFEGHTGASLQAAARSAGRVSLLLSAAVLVVWTLFAWAEQLGKVPRPSRRVVRGVGTVVAVAVIALGVAGVLVATHGNPVSFVKRQWHGFVHIQSATASSSSHFFSVGSGRYDFWRVSVDAVKAHPLGGLGQDNFADYYITRRRTGEEPRWTHSLEFRLLAHTGIVGLLLFASFLVAALVAAAGAIRRSSPLLAAAAAAALIPLLPWLVHGSVDWFWEVPALSGPAFAFLGMAAGLRRPRLGSPAPATPADETVAAPPRRTPAGVRIGLACLGVVALVAATVALGFAYLSVRYTSIATDIRAKNSAAALSDLSTAADLDPWSPDPTRLAGTIALDTGRPLVAQKWFSETTAREPQGWFGWFGRGLAASALGDSAQATRDFRIAASINSRETIVADALSRVNTKHPLTPGEAVRTLAQAR
jgi:O-Antigen ligase